MSSLAVKIAAVVDSDFLIPAAKETWQLFLLGFVMAKKGNLKLGLIVYGSLGLIIFLLCMSGREKPNSSIDNKSIKPLKPSVPINWPEQTVLPHFKDGVAFDIRFNNPKDKTPTIIGYTNLPDGSSMLVELSRSKLKYWEESEAVVKDGRFYSQQFSTSDLPLPAGTYSVEITTGMPSTQPAEVLRTIGKNGENLKGKWAINVRGQKMVKFDGKLELGGSPSEQDDKDFITKLKQVHEQQKEEDLKAALGRIPQAKVLCKMFINESLNDPDSAEFDDYVTYTATYNNEIYDVHIGLRARNGFNALRHATFSCKLGLTEHNLMLLGIKQIHN